eukprot:9526410-Alexandrium_andersonii.AAC.1
MPCCGAGSGAAPRGNSQRSAQIAATWTTPSAELSEAGQRRHALRFAEFLPGCWPGVGAA